jgi:hypothetical protein
MSRSAQTQPAAHDDAAGHASLNQPLWHYPVFAAAWLSGLLFAASHLVSMSLGAFLLCSALLAVPPALLRAQHAHLRRSDALRHWRPESLWHSLLAGAWLRPLISLFGSAAVLGWVLLHLAIETELRPGIIAVAVLLPFSIILMRNRLRHSLKPAWMSLWPVRLGAWLTVGCVLIGTLWLTNLSDEAPASLAATRAAYPTYAGTSALLDIVYEGTTFSAAVMAYGFAIAARGASDWAVALALANVLLRAGLLLAVSQSLAAFMLPMPQLKLAFSPVSEEPAMAMDPSRRLLLGQAATVIGLGGMGYWGLTRLDAAARTHGLPTWLRSGTQLAEQIDDGSYKVGTVRILAAFEAEARQMIGQAQQEALRGIRTGFNHARCQIDSYLDWHFSLLGEATRMLGIESNAAGLRDRLGLGLIQRQADIVFARLDGFTEALRSLGDMAQTVLRTQRLDHADMRTRTVLSTTRADLFPTLLQWRETVPFNVRMKTTAAITPLSSLSGAVLGSYLGGRLATRGGVAVLGATAGSIVPGLGTAAGFMGGLLFATVVDWGLLKFNEATDRDKLRKALLDRLDGEERKLMIAIASLQPPVRTTSTTLYGPTMPQPTCKIPGAKA